MLHSRAAAGFAATATAEPMRTAYERTNSAGFQNAN